MSSLGSPASALNNPSTQPVTYKLSCSHCRQRKVKCNKVYPCTPCVKASLGCVFPERKKDRKPRQNKNHELLKRLAKLEAIVEQVSPANLANAQRQVQENSDVGSDQQQTEDSVKQEPASSASPKASSEISDLNRKPSTATSTSSSDPTTKYLSGEFWANLCNEVEGIRHTLEHSGDSDSDDDATGSTPGSQAAQSQGLSARYTSPSHRSPPAIRSGGSPYYVTTAPAIFGHGAGFSADGEPSRPSPSSGAAMLAVYMRNVDPVLKILHRPTISAAFTWWCDPASQETVDSAAEALYFAMCFAAVTSVTDSYCATQLNEERSALVLRYRQSAEVALARADYLNNTTLQSLQAFTLYVTCLRSHHESRASWALLALVLRLSQALGLHRDGDTGAGFTPYEAELRRRLWCQVVILDVRAAEDRGAEVMIPRDMYSTALPSNVDDEQFGPDTTVPVQSLARPDGVPTDITFALCTVQCSDAFVFIHLPLSRFSDALPVGDASRHKSPEEALQEAGLQIIQRLEDKFLTSEDPTKFTSATAARVVQIVSLIFWLQIQYPFQVRSASASASAASSTFPPQQLRTQISREHILQTATSIMELQELDLVSADFTERFRWWNETYVQWHALAVALAELCVQTEGLLVERAWQIVDKVFPLWGDRIADTKRGTLWRPIKKLLRKARDARAQALVRKLDLGGVAAAANNSTAASSEIPPTSLTQPTSMAEDSDASFGVLDIPPLMMDDQFLSQMNPLIGNNFGSLAPNTIAEGGAGMENFSMDWSYWNDFVNDATLGLEQ